MLLIALVWAALPHLDSRDREYEKRLIGALEYLEGAV